MTPEQKKFKQILKRKSEELCNLICPGFMPSVIEHQSIFTVAIIETLKEMKK